MIINFEYKSILFCFLICLYSSGIFSQNTAITDDDSYNAHSSAMLDVYSQTKGMLVPRLSTSQMNGISSAAPGLLIFNTDSTRFYFYTGAEWMAVQGGQFLQTSADSVVHFSTDKYVGVGTKTPMSKLSVQASSSNSNVPLFDVKNKAGDTIFAVYETGVVINFNEDAIGKGAKGGFAVGGLSTGKSTPTEYLRVTSDSVRIYFNDAAGKGAKGGFAVGGLSTGKAMGNKYFTLSDTNARIDLRPAAKGAKGGFAVGGLSTGKSTASDLFTISPDSARIYIDSDAKGAKGGFAVGGLSTGKAGSQDYLRITRDSARMYIGEPAKGAKGGFAVGGLSTGKAGSNFLDLTPENYFIGHSAGANTTPGTGDAGRYNAFIGYKAGLSNTTGEKNIFLGYESGYFNTEGEKNIFIGYGSGKNNVGVGTHNGDYNVFVGTETGASNTSGYANTFIGFTSGTSNTTGFRNTFIGSNSGHHNTQGARNVALGYFAGFNADMGDNNIFIGPSCGYSAHNSENVIFIGKSAGNYAENSSNSILIGYQAGWRTKAESNIFIGYRAGGTLERTGTNNVFLGDSTGTNNIAGNRNVFIGPTAGYNETGSNKLHIANDADFSLIYGEFDNKLVEIDGNLKMKSTYFHVTNNPGTATSPSNYVYQGGSASSTGKEYAYAISDALWVTSNTFIDGTLNNKKSAQKASEILFKEAVPLSIDVNKLGEIELYQYNTTEKIVDENNSTEKTVKRPDIGIHPEKLKILFPELVWEDGAGETFINYAKLSVILLDAIKQQQKAYADQQEKIDLLQQQVNDNKELQFRIEKLEEALKD